MRWGYKLRRAARRFAPPSQLEGPQGASPAPSRLVDRRGIGYTIQPCVRRAGTCFNVVAGRDATEGILT